VRRITLAALAVALVVTAGCGSNAGTALREDGGFTKVGGVIRKRDKPFAYGAVAVSNTDSETVTLKSVELVGARGLRLLGNYVNTTGNGIAIWPSFPGPGIRVKPLDGTPALAHPPTEVILKLERHGPALPKLGDKAAWFTGLTITYDQGGETKTQTFHRQLTAWTKPRFGRNVNK
jgi:hypothetical protein